MPKTGVGCKKTFRDIIGATFAIMVIVGVPTISFFKQLFGDILAGLARFKKNVNLAEAKVRIRHLEDDRPKQCLCQLGGPCAMHKRGK